MEVADHGIKERTTEDALQEMTPFLIAHDSMKGMVVAVVRPQFFDVLVIVLVPEGVMSETVSHAEDPWPFLEVQLNIQVVIEILFTSEIHIPQVHIAALVACRQPERLIHKGHAVLRYPTA